MSLAKWTVGLMAGMSMLAFAAQANAGEVRVTVAEYSAKTGPYFEEVKKEFEAKNPGITVKFEIVPWDVLLQKLTTDITAGTNADLSIIGTRWLIDFVQQDVAEPLDGYITPDFKGRFIDTFLSPSIMNGKTYGLPIAASARAMYYNKELFEKAGIAKPPATWTELQDDARKIKALGTGAFGFGLQGKEIETDVYYYYAMWSQGTEILNKDGSSGLGTPGALEAAKLYKSMIDEGLTEPGVTSNNREDVQNLFKQGKVGMMITAPFLSNQIKDEAPKLKYGVAAIPAGPTGARGTYGVTDSMIMFKNSKNKDEAWKLMDFLFTTEQRAKFTQGEGFLPVNKEEAKMDYYVNNADLAAFTALLPDARFAPVIPGWEEVAQITSDAMQKIYLGGDPEAGLKDAAAKANAVLKK
ncbi:ABC transporter substrate-binding protein [Mesorhizobium huakuii]|uniref:Sugar ABC transporter substrate-binding protein n=1 Tax=Mesorhizobium huakuii TaxID=28104 RepID=A0A7G6SS83_9HYPH|nr:sugar ABC transporter substrate-binding protein [Mesorhizobium huakuii]QND57365.1 sugar ABC transporter substrate-binding protein [Mesorhizobium huakuii]